MNRKLKMGMVGGGRGAFIGGVHRRAANLDGQIELVAGAFSSDPKKSKLSGKDFYIDPSRVYGSYQEMAEKEALLPVGERIDFVSIVVQNYLHFDVAKTFLKAGFNVICDKPVTLDLSQARELKKIINKSKKVFALTHNYTGYPMVREARELISKGDLGDIRVVQVEYAQDWLSEPLENTGLKQAEWRTDPARSGVGGATGDIGTHAYNLVSFISGLKLKSLCADLDSFVDGRKVDDNGHVLLRFEGGAKGMLWCSQVAPGNENALSIRIYGSKGGIEWHQEAPNYLWHTPLGEPKRLITRNGAGAGNAAARMSRIPPGHPEGYLEGFANIYGEAAAAIRAKIAGYDPGPDVLYPTIQDGVAGVVFVDACVRSSKCRGAWVNV